MTGIPILISLGATASPDSDTNDTMQLLTTGELFSLPNGYKLCYEEQLDETASPTQIELTLQDGIVSMLRSGDYATDMVFRKGQRYEGQYSTPYGEMELGIYCTRVNYQVDKNGGLVTLQYQLDLNGQFASMHDMQLRFMVRENDESPK